MHLLSRLALLACLLLPLGAHARTPDPISGKLIFHAAGGCGCHTDSERNGPPLAGGRPLPTPFGTFYSNNITPDPETGIGHWSDSDFLQAMVEGVGPEGTHYFPSFPYTSFSKMTEEDLLHLKDYLFSLPPDRQVNRPHNLPFPFSLRAGAWFWKLLYHHPEPLLDDPKQSSSWNRGRYLTEAVAHCGECHTPRNLLGALRPELAYAGSKEGPEGELAPNITPDPETGIGKWSASDLTYALQTGMVPDGDFLGGLMGKAIEHYQELPESDLQAISEYLLSLPPITNQVREPKPESDW
jgi:mono/diheme cytochrome c family protein